MLLIYSCYVTVVVVVVGDDAVVDVAEVVVVVVVAAVDEEDIAADTQYSAVDSASLPDCYNQSWPPALPSVPSYHACPGPPSSRTSYPAGGRCDRGAWEWAHVPAPSVSAERPCTACPCVAEAGDGRARE